MKPFSRDAESAERSASRASRFAFRASLRRLRVAAKQLVPVADLKHDLKIEHARPRDRRTESDAHAAGIAVLEIDPGGEVDLIRVAGRVGEGQNAAVIERRAHVYLDGRHHRGDAFCAVA